MSKTNLFSIGDTAKMFHLSVSTLRHYEAQGLLVPEYIDPDSRYRYYSFRQFEVLNTIRYLRVLELPLEKIKTILQKKDLQQMETLLKEQQVELQKKQEELALMERKINARLQQLHDAQTTPLEQIQLKKFPAMKVVWIEEPVNVAEPYAIEQSIRKLDASQATIFLGKVGVGLSKQTLERHQYQEYDCIFLVLEEGDHHEGESTVIPEETCVTLRFAGGHHESKRYYQQMMQWIEAHHYTVAGFSKEITLIDEGITTDSDSFVTEIRIPVKEKKYEKN